MGSQKIIFVWTDHDTIETSPMCLLFSCFLDGIAKNMLQFFDNVHVQYVVSFILGLRNTFYQNIRLTSKLEFFCLNDTIKKLQYLLLCKTKHFYLFVHSRQFSNIQHFIFIILRYTSTISRLISKHGYSFILSCVETRWMSWISCVISFVGNGTE